MWVKVKEFFIMKLFFVTLETWEKRTLVPKIHNQNNDVCLRLDMTPSLGENRACRYDLTFLGWCLRLPRNYENYRDCLTLI